MIENSPDKSFRDSPFKRRLSGRIPEVDGLRGLAILGVLVFHLFCRGIDYEKSHWIATYAAKIGSIGSTGVDLFFVISGFLIGGILIDTRESPNYFKTFYLRRIFRIFPLYYGLLFIFYILSFASAYKLISVANWMVGFNFSGKWYLTFTQNFPMARDGNLGAAALAPTWSLAVEEQFYVLLPLIIFFVPRKYLTALVVALIFGASIFRTVTWHQTSSIIATRMQMPGCLDSLMMGVLIAILLRSPKPSILIERYRLKLVIPVLLVLLMVLFIVYKFSLNAWPKFAGNQWILGSPMFSLLYGSLIILAVSAKPKHLLSKFLCNNLLRKIGQLSYFIFLFHVGINIFVRWLTGSIAKPPFGITWFFEIGLTLIITIFLANLSWHYFEKPLMKLGHKYGYKT